MQFNTLTNWSMTNSLLDFHLASDNDFAVIGGDLAYQYGQNGSLSGIGLSAAQSVINATSFGRSAQSLNNPSVWQAEVAKLS